MDGEIQKRRCPECESSRLTADGDIVERLDHNGQLVSADLFQWWNCDECGHQFRYEDDSLNPGGKYRQAKESEVPQC